MIYKRESGDDNFIQNITVDEISKYFKVIDSKGIKNERCPIEKYELVKYYQSVELAWIEELSSHDEFYMDESFNLIIQTSSDGFRSEDLQIKAISRGDQFVYLPIMVEVCGTEQIFTSET